MNRFVAATVAGIFLLGFTGLYGNANIDTFRWDESKPDIKFNETYILIATGLAGLVAGVASTAMQPGAPGRIRHADWDVLVIATAAYVIVFFLVGLAAIIAAITWNPKEPEKHPCPDLVKNLAMISFGLGLSTVRFFFNLPDPPTGGGSGGAKDGK